MASEPQQSFDATVAATIKASEDAARQALIVDDGPQAKTEGDGEKELNLVEGSSDGTYFLPNHESEATRLDLQHQIFQLSFNNNLALAPIVPKDLKNVLDIGTGSGIWSVEFAQQHPQARVTGFDISPCNPAHTPANCTFTIANAEAPWPFSEPFSYIHGRALMSCFALPFSVIQSAFSALTPGGYLELQDCCAPWSSLDNTLQATTLWKYHSMTIAAAASLGRDVTQVVKYKAFFKEAGFVDVKEVHYQWPVGPWAKGEKMKRVGSLFQEDAESLVGVLAERLLVKGAGMGKEDADRMVEAVRRDMRDPGVHAYMPGIVVYGRKPE